MKNLSEDSKYWLEIVGNNLRHIRNAQKQSLQAVARALKISPGRLGAIEKGEYDMELWLLMELCDYYDVRPADVVREDFKYPVE